MHIQSKYTYEPFVQMYVALNHYDKNKKLWQQVLYHYYPGPIQMDFG